MGPAGGWRSSAARSSGRTTATSPWSSRFAAGAMGIPFMPIRSLLGSDVLLQAGAHRRAARADPRTPLQEGARDGVALRPGRSRGAGAGHPHRVRRAPCAKGQPRRASVRIEGQTFADVQQALCADTVIVTAEEIVDDGDLRRGAGAQPAALLRGQARLPRARTAPTPTPSTTTTTMTRGSSSSTTRAPRMKRRLRRYLELVRATGCESHAGVPGG